MTQKITLMALAALAAVPLSARHTETLDGIWRFAEVDSTGRQSAWQNVRVPHDWAIHKPFSRDNDLQRVAVEQNGETEKTEKTGRTGGLPYMGRGVYTTDFEVADTAGQVFSLIFDGAMSNPHVEVNGKKVGHWAYGYNSFHLNLAPGVIRPGLNTVTVSLENKPESSRWYPGAGLYRNVHLLSTSKIHIPVWGTYVTTPDVSATEASVKLEMKIDGANKGETVRVNTEIISPQGKVVATNDVLYHSHGQPFTQNFLVEHPDLWDTENPTLYTARTVLSVDGKEVDRYDTRFGIRKIEYIPERGFFLNGKRTMFKGVCNHHDLGPLGAAVNTAALRHQIELLKEMGANAIRTSHNMPAPELVALCDEMGMMMMIEPFDDWGFRPKSKNGYGSIFKQWAEKDMVNMLHQYRNSPSVVMWSIGNEVPSQWGPDGISELEMLQGICHREDPTRPVTCGMDQISSVLDNGFAAALDIPGFNYKPMFYKRAYEVLPQKLVLGTETASTVSSRGVYMFPLDLKAPGMHDNNQSSSYDTEYCWWSNIPELDFQADEDWRWFIGQFVWTGFDYLGEPTPYDTDAWPSHSSLFGIIDLASLPKDRYWLYRSQWNTTSPTLHILPHWTWPGREGQTTPVMVYTSYPAAELFVNGKSMGIKRKNPDIKAESVADDVKNYDDISATKMEASRRALDRYRLIWDDVVYEPGTVKVVGIDANGNRGEEAEVVTAGKPTHIVLSANQKSIKADGNDLVYVTVQVADKNGNIVPTDNRLVKFKVSGAAEFLATANGDPTCLLPMDAPAMNLFSGAATCILRASKTPGTAKLTVSAPGVKSATIDIQVK